MIIDALIIFSLMTHNLLIFALVWMVMNRWKQEGGK